MNIIKYPNDNEVDNAIKTNEPMLAVIAFDCSEMIISHIDVAVEHHILLAKAGRKDTDIDRYFRVILDEGGAEWTFVCPMDYKGIIHKDKRLSEFYKDGFATITLALKALNMPVNISIPKRYRRHFNMLSE